MHVLEGVGAIKATRGRVRIFDRAKLEEMAEGCYGVAEAEYERLMGLPIKRLLLQVSSLAAGRIPTASLPGYHAIDGPNAKRSCDRSKPPHCLSARQIRTAADRKLSRLLERQNWGAKLPDTDRRMKSASGQNRTLVLPGCYPNKNSGPEQAPSAPIIVANAVT